MKITKDDNIDFELPEYFNFKFIEKNIKFKVYKIRYTYKTIRGNPKENLLGEYTYNTTDCDRTGCVYCCYGANQIGDERFLRLKETHPSQYKYCMEKLGMAEVLDYIGVNYK